MRRRSLITDGYYYYSMDETDGNLLESFADTPSNGKERETYAEQQRGWTEIISNINWW